jgi:hypothetical protein
MEFIMNELNKNKSQALTPSLRYPLFTIEKSLEKLKIIFTKNSKNFIASETMIADLGFSPNSGSSTSWIAAFKYYNFLIKDEKNNKYRLNDNIIDYCINNSVNHDLIYPALQAVPINRRIFSIYDFNDLPSENEIKSFLVKDCSYNLKQATTYIEIFNQNMLFYKKNNIGSHTIQKIGEVNNLRKISDNSDEQENKINTNNIGTFLYKNGNIIFQMPSDLSNVDKVVLEDIQDVINLINNKINKQLKK